jgi:hypothetical protein
MLWTGLCIFAALGLHLYQRIDIMLGYGHSWKDAGVQLRAARRRRSGQREPVSPRTDPVRIPPTPQPQGDWKFEHRTPIVHAEKAPWPRMDEPEVAPGTHTMTLIRPADDGR